MAHKFDLGDDDPYSEAAHAVEERAFTGEFGFHAGAMEQMYGTLANAIVTALGDVAEVAFKNGVNSPQQLAGLADAVAAVSKKVILGYQGEVSAEPVLQAIENDPRLETLAAPSRLRLLRELQRTRQLEALKPAAPSLPALLDMAGSLGLELDEETLLDTAPVTIPGTQMPGPGVTKTE